MNNYNNKGERDGYWESNYEFGFGYISKGFFIEGLKCGYWIHLGQEKNWKINYLNDERIDLIVYEKPIETTTYYIGAVDIHIEDSCI